MKLAALLNTLRAESVETWFDLGLFLDRLREDPPSQGIKQTGSLDDFKEEIKKGGIGMLTFHYMVDGVTVEAEKYAALLRRSLPGTRIHFIAGKMHYQSPSFFHPDHRHKVIRELAGFDDWDLYRDFYFTRLERGSRTYNALIGKLWKQSLSIVEKLGAYIEEEGISLLYAINVNSNPGNVAFALAIVLLSEYMGIPVINNNHDQFNAVGHSSTLQQPRRV